MGNPQHERFADSAAMLDLWEQAADRSGVGQALALLSAVRADLPPEERAALPIGRRDADLLTLHDALFGSRIECTADCSACGATMEVDFDIPDMRTAAASVSDRFAVEHDGIVAEVRLPDSRDLATIEALQTVEPAWETLVRRCVVDARRGDRPVPVAELPRALLEAIDAAAAEHDPQADLTIGLACPDCGAEMTVPFDICHQLWKRLDHWSRKMLGAVDTIAGRYGWSETEILALGPRRLQRYLDLIGRDAL